MSAADAEALADADLGAAAAKLLGDRRLIIATNRGPVTFTTAADGSLRPRRGSGGLVTALGQVGRHVPVTWVAAAMSEGDRRAAADPRLARAALADDEQLRLRFVSVERSVYEQAYNVIANPLLWFLQHQMWNLPERPIIDAATLRAWERGYVAMNEAFAAAIVAQTRGDKRPRIMLHDYHLYCAAEPIRRSRPQAILSHFTHIPMPPSSIWQAVAPPIREGIAIGLLANDVVGFQTDRYAHNFLRMVESFVPDATVDYEKSEVRRRRRTTRVRTYPISIDVDATSRIAGSRAARRRADQLLGRDPRAGHRPRRPARAVEEHPARLPRLRGAPPAPLASPRPDQLPGLPGPVADRPARVRPVRADGAERGGADQRPIRTRGLAARSSSSTRTTTPRRWRASRSPTSCSSIPSSTG